MKRTFGALAILIIVILVGHFLWKNVVKAPSIEDSAVYIAAEFPGKLVYVPNETNNIEALRQDCSERQGEFNSCGSPCAPDAEVCVDVCAYTCEFASDESDSTTWREISLTNGSAMINYPAGLLEAESTNETVTLLHKVPYEHTDPCDFQGGAPDLETLTDFHLTFKIFNSNLSETVAQREADSFVADNMENGEFRLAEGFIDRFEEGALKGYQLTFGVENCGMYVYYFPLSAERTLVIDREFVTELRDSVMRENAEKVPGVILPEYETELFRKILKTFQAA